ncbi:Cytochrome c1-2, heme protein, mitochondrial (Fragment) [Linum perenne]
MAGGGAIRQLLQRKLQSRPLVPSVSSFFNSKKGHDEAGSLGEKSLRALALVGVGLSGLLASAIASASDEGEMFTRPGKLSDRFPQPYANESAARFANGGAYPPDLSLITKARHNGQNYVFALLTGYRDPPAGISIREGLHYNPYFPGGAIAMPKMLNDGAVEYEDGTPATEAQMGKDVVSFLTWAAEPEMEERKLMGFKWIFLLSLALLQVGYHRRMRWSVLKSRKLIVDVVN